VDFPGSRKKGELVEKRGRSSLLIGKEGRSSRGNKNEISCKNTISSRKKSGATEKKRNLNDSHRESETNLGERVNILSEWSISVGEREEIRNLCDARTLAIDRDGQVSARKGSLNSRVVFFFLLWGTKFDR